MPSGIVLHTAPVGVVLFFGRPRRGLGGTEPATQDGSLEMACSYKHFEGCRPDYMTTSAPKHPEYTGCDKTTKAREKGAEHVDYRL